MTEMKVEIGKRVEQIRRQKVMTKKAFSKLLGFSDSYLSTVERGKHGLTIEKAVLLCEISGVTLDYLILGREMDNPEETKKSAVYSMKNILSDLTVAQIKILCEIICNIAVFSKTDDFNELLLKGIFEARTNQLSGIE